MSNLIQVATVLYEHKAEICEAVAAILGGVGALASFVSHYVPLPAVWAERVARFAAYTSQKFSVNKRDAGAKK